MTKWYEKTKKFLAGVSFNFTDKHSDEKELWKTNHIKKVKQNHTGYEC